MVKRVTKKTAFSDELTFKRTTKKAAFGEGIDLELVRTNALISALEQRAGLTHAKALEVVHVLQQLA